MYYDEYDRMRLITNPNIIARRYATGPWFAFDLLTSFPFSYVLIGVDEDGHSNDINTVEGTTLALRLLRFLRLFRLLRVFRVYKMLGIIKELNRQFPSFKKWLGIFNVTIFMIFVAHYFACIWFAVG